MNAPSPKLARALADIRRVVAVSRLPHALLVVGHPRGDGLSFVESLLQTLFALPSPEASHAHVDIHWLEPEGKARQFRTSKDDDVIRPQIEFLSQTSYSGGWKALVFLFADRLGDTAQNVLLKTLEEPPRDSLLVLVTDTPSALLPTIRSRVQRVDVLSDASPAASGAPPPAWLDAILPLLRNPPPTRLTEIFAWADALAVPLRALKEQAETEEAEADPDAKRDVLDGRVATRVKELREEWFRALLAWQRDVLSAVLRPDAPPVAYPAEADAIRAQAAQLTPEQALARVSAVEGIRTLLAHNLREAVVFPRLARALALPPPPA
jgi:hypothetical protein